MRYVKGTLELRTPNKDGGWIIVVKATGTIVPGTREYDSLDSAMKKLHELEEGD